VYKPIIEANPDIYFIEPAFTLAETPNAATYEWDVHIGAFLEGVVAGAITKTNKIGLVSAFKDPYDARTFNCYKQGAEEVNPDVECYYAFTGDYHDVSLGMKAGTALLAVDCDVLIGIGNGMTNGVIKACEAEGAYTMGVYSDQYDLAPSVVVTSTLWNAGRYKSDAIRDYLNGTFSHPHYGYDLKDESVTLAPFNPDIPVPAIINETINKLRDANRQGTYSLSDSEEWPTGYEIA
jgi:basic membrane lipoprotein Med (substrate-binding protein (PBP1-ABC) superfamily)